ncbi:hypothetical protein AAC387_Pa08g1354 [Persea americana]
MASLSLALVFLLVSSSCLVLDAQSSPPLVKGMSFTFYRSTCPNLEKIVTDYLRTVFRKDIGQAAALLRIHFHDCFVQSGGPNYQVPLGRRDGLTFATRDATLNSLPGPNEQTPALIAALSRINLDVTDLVALSGGHTIGISHCTSFEDRLYPTQDTTMDQTFAKNLKVTCPKKNSSNTTPLDIRSPNKFDNKYYVDLMNRQGLFTSDQGLYSNKTTQPIVTKFAINETAFFEQFALSMVKMGQLSVLTGTQGEIRANCSARNSARSALWSVVDDEGEAAAAF